jgi:hypothetical protein
MYPISNYNFLTERRDKVVSIPASYFVRPGFKYCPEDCPNRVFMVYSNPDSKPALNQATIVAFITFLTHYEATPMSFDAVPVSY